MVKSRPWPSGAKALIWSTGNANEKSRGFEFFTNDTFFTDDTVLTAAAIKKSENAFFPAQAFFTLQAANGSFPPPSARRTP
jgi:hypothetical protein